MRHRRLSPKERHKRAVNVRLAAVGIGSPFLACGLWFVLATVPNAEVLAIGIIAAACWVAAFWLAWEWNRI